jgi:hypothetical protein
MERAWKEGYKRKFWYQIYNYQYIYTAETLHSESVLTEHSYALGIDALDIVKDDSTNNENKNEHTSNLTYMVYQLKHRIVELERQLQISKKGSPLMTWGRGFLCKVVESCPMCKQGSGFSLVGFPLIKCIEHTLSLYVGFHNFPVFASFLLMFLIHLTDNFRKFW